MFKKFLLRMTDRRERRALSRQRSNWQKTKGWNCRWFPIEELPSFPASIDEVIEEKSEANHVYEAVTSRAVAQAQAQGVKLIPHILVGHPVPAICDFVAKGGFDLLVIGYMGHSALYNRLIGSTTDRLVEHARSRCWW